MPLPPASPRFWRDAADTGCTLVLENCDDTNPFARIEMARRIGHPRLKVSLDRGACRHLPRPL
jgi:hypothetical protein